MYVLGLFVLAIGISLSIEADLGVSPVSSLAYAFSLTTGFSVGMMTIVANLVYIIFQIILSKRFYFREIVVQFIISFLHGVLLDLALFLVRLLPSPETMLMKWVFLILSCFVCALGLLGYFSAKFPLMPYDELTHVISQRFKFILSRAKIYSDTTNVVISGTICLIFIQSFGAVGLGTIFAAYFIGKILGVLIKYFQAPLIHWMNKSGVVSPHL